MNVLALDLATQTGWAYWGTYPGAAEPMLTWGTERFDGLLGDALLKLARWLRNTIEVCSIERVVFESPWVDGKTHQQVARKLQSMAGVVEMVCCKRNVACYEQRAPQVRRHFLGRDGPKKRAEIKLATVKQCRLLGWDVANDDEADAVALLHYVAALWRIGHLPQDRRVMKW